MQRALRSDSFDSEHSVCFSDSAGEERVQLLCAPMCVVALAQRYGYRMFDSVCRQYDQNGPLLLTVSAFVSSFRACTGPELSGDMQKTLAVYERLRGQVHDALPVAVAANDTVLTRDECCAYLASTQLCADSVMCAWICAYLCTNGVG